MARASWKPHEKRGKLTERGDLPNSVFAYPKKRKEPMTDPSHVRNAIARFDQVTGVSDQERQQAFANIKKAAKHYGVAVSESEWKELARTRKRRGDGQKKTRARKRGAKRAAATRKKKTRKESTRKKVTRNRR